MMDKTRTVSQKCLINELVLSSFYGIKKCAKTQSNPINLSKVYVSTNDKHIDTDAKTVFSDSGGLKTWRFRKKLYFYRKKMFVQFLFC